MISNDLFSFLKNVDKLSKGEMVALKRNYAMLDKAGYNAVLIFLKCVPDGVSKSEYETLFFIASVRCELGHADNVKPKDAVAKILSGQHTGDTRFSDLLRQSVEFGRVYPMIRRYLSMYGGPIDTVELYYNLLSWDKERSSDLENRKFNLSVKEQWAAAYAKAKRVK